MSVIFSQAKRNNQPFCLLSSQVQTTQEGLCPNNSAPVLGTAQLKVKIRFDTVFLFSCSIQIFIWDWLSVIAATKNSAL